MEFSLAEMQPLHWGGKEKKKKGKKESQEKNQLLGSGRSCVNLPSHATRSCHAACLVALTLEQIPGLCCLSWREHLIFLKIIIIVITPAETRQLLDEFHTPNRKADGRENTSRDLQLQLSPGIIRERHAVLKMVIRQ